jgi:hypothetical protein
MYRHRIIAMQADQCFLLAYLLNYQILAVDRQRDESSVQLPLLNHGNEPIPALTMWLEFAFGDKFPITSQRLTHDVVIDEGRVSKP